MDGLLARLTAKLQEAGVEQPVFREGCSAAELAALERALGFSLPRDYVELLGCADGQRDARALSFPPGNLTFLSASEVKSLWSELRPHGDRSSFDETQDEARIRSVIYDALRVPIAYDEMATAYLFLDGIPGPRGTPMQLIANATEIDFLVVARSVRELFETYLRLLDSGQMRVLPQPAEHGSGHWFVGPDDQPLDVDRFVALVAEQPWRG